MDTTPIGQFTNQIIDPFSSTSCKFLPIFVNDSDSSSGFSTSFAKIACLLLCIKNFFAKKNSTGDSCAVESLSLKGVDFSL
jgi:hypothetical protein